MLILCSAPASEYYAECDYADQQRWYLFLPYRAIVTILSRLLPHEGQVSVDEY